MTIHIDESLFFKPSQQLKPCGRNLLNDEKHSGKTCPKEIVQPLLKSTQATILVTPAKYPATITYVGWTDMSTPFTKHYPCRKWQHMYRNHPLPVEVNNNKQVRRNLSTNLCKQTNIRYSNPNRVFRRQHIH